MQYTKWFCTFVPTTGTKLSKRTSLHTKPHPFTNESWKEANKFTSKYVSLFHHQYKEKSTAR